MEFFAKNAPDPLHWTLNSCIAAFRSVWVHFGLFRCCTELFAKWAELVQLMQKILPWSRTGIFATNAPEPPHWTPNSCFDASRSIWVHLAMFHYYTKLGAKRDELVPWVICAIFNSCFIWQYLMHKFVPWSRFGIFRNECTRPTPLDPKLMFWGVS